MRLQELYNEFVQMMFNNEENLRARIEKLTTENAKLRKKRRTLRLI